MGYWRKNVGGGNIFLSVLLAWLLLQEQFTIVSMKQERSEVDFHQCKESKTLFPNAKDMHIHVF